MAQDVLHSVPSAAKFLGGISAWTVRSWLSQGRLRRTKIGSRTMIRQSELERFLAECEEAQATPLKRLS
jgi:excisionase family DNA binding protein